MRRSNDGTSSIVVAATARHPRLVAEDCQPHQWPLKIRYGFSDPKPGLLSAHLKLNLPPAVGVDVLHPEFERAKLGND
jgi:hypothetical protein